MSKPPKGSSYSLKVIVMSIQFIIFGRISLRGTSYAVSKAASSQARHNPCHTTTQLWMLKYGLYLLEKPKEKRNDWIWILDHTIEFGTKKCLVIVGIEKEKLAERKCKIKHEDLTVLDIFITNIADADSVKKRFNKLKKDIGIPVQIISDGGGNIRGAIKQLIEECVDNNIIKTYDVTHKASLILKSALENDKRWNEFTKQVTKTKRSLVHTVLSFMCPPKPKDKSRWLNLESFVKWSENSLLQGKEFMDQKSKEKYNSKVSWVNDFSKDIKKWRTMLELLDIMMNEVKNEGFSSETYCNVSKKMKKVKSKAKQIVNIKCDILDYISQETSGMQDVYLGSSDIIESIFGRYKNFSSKTPMREVGKAVLTMPVFTNQLNSLEVKKAMEKITEKQVQDWLNKNIGVSLFAKRLKFCNLSNKNKKIGEKNGATLTKCA